MYYVERHLSKIQNLPSLLSHFSQNPHDLIFQDPVKIASIDIFILETLSSSLVIILIVVSN
jgi:hypothetical protein